MIKEIIIHIPQSFHGGKMLTQVQPVHYFNNDQRKQDYKYGEVTSENMELVRLRNKAAEDLQELRSELITLSGARVCIEYDYQGTEMTVKFIPDFITDVVKYSYQE